MSAAQRQVVLVTTKGKRTRSFVQLFAQFGEFLKRPGRGAIAVIGGKAEASPRG